MPNKALQILIMLLSRLKANLWFNYLSSKYDKRFQILSYFGIKDYFKISQTKIYLYWQVFDENILRPIFFYFHTSENNGDVTDFCYKNPLGYLFNVRYWDASYLSRGTKMERSGQRQRIQVFQERSYLTCTRIKLLALSFYYSYSLVVLVILQ